MKLLAITLPAKQWEHLLSSASYAAQDYEAWGYDSANVRTEAYKALRDAYEAAIIAAIDEEGK
jgi:hypothetical protein